MMPYLPVKRSIRAYRLTLFVLLVTLTSALFAQPDNWNIRYYNAEDGLSSNHINAIFKDSKGIIWVGTDNGLNWFDGYMFSQLKYASGQDHLLSRIKVLSICEDSDSLLWVGTSDGLFRFDPSEPVDQIRQYRYREPDSLESIPQPQPVNRICEDKNGLLWMNTADPDDGIPPDLLTFNRSEEVFKVIKELQVTGETPRVIDASEIVRGIYSDRNDSIWLSTYNGLFKYTYRDNIFRNYTPFPGSDLPHRNALLSAYEDTYGNFWAAGVYGLFEFDRETEKFGDPIILHEQVGLHGNQSAIYYISQDAEGYLWIRVNEALFRARPVPDSKKKLEIRDMWDPEIENFSTINERMTLLIEHPRSVWIAMANRGLCHISIQENNFRLIRPGSLLQGYPENVNYVTALFADTFNNLWFSTELSGPVRYNMVTGETEYAQLMPFKMISQIDVDMDGNLWFASRYAIHHRTELERHNLQKLESYYPDSARFDALTERMETGAYGIGSLSMYFYGQLMDKDTEGRIWFNSEKGIHDRYVHETNAFIHLDHRRVDHYNNDTCLVEKAGELWIPTKRGLKRIVPPFTEISPNTFIPEHTILYQEVAGDTTSLNSNWVKSVYTSEHFEPGTMWIATIGGGLNKMVKQKAEGSDAPEIHFKHYTASDGLCNNNILGILEDKSGNLWLSTLNGLSKFDPRTERFFNFYEEDGLPSNEFSTTKPSAGVSGKMFFPQAREVLVFDPDSIKSNHRIPELCITHLSINSQQVLPGPRSPLKKEIRYVNDIELRYDQNFLSFEFAALDFEAPERNQYRYMLEGLDRDWIHAGTRRFADYPGLKPGKYTFRVTGSNNNGVWNEAGRSLHITIHRPPWYSWWAITLYALFLTGLILWFRLLLVRRSRTMRALEIERIDKEKALEVDRLKSRFFTNISHEFRTPLSLITGPVQNALRSGEEKAIMDREEAEMVERNALRLRELIDQLLDISKLESGTDRLKVESGNLGEFVRSVFSNFLSLAESKAIEYRLDTGEAGAVSWFDPDKTEKILVNLINNAFKFTDPGGRIGVRLRYLEDPAAGHLNHAELTVSDSGKGIPPEKIERIFDRFYQANSSDTRDQEGTGIGLSLVKEIVDLCRGEISVASKYGEGTTFRVRLPVSREHFRDDEHVSSGNLKEAERPEAAVTGISETGIVTEATQEDSQQASASVNEGSLVLVVEDNPDLRKYISSLLEKEHHVMTAENGRTGLERARKHLPDLVISDLMMPEMSGTEMTAKLKQDPATNHIPVVMLTAKADKESMLEGLDTGADDYLIKPFNAEELQARVRNLIRQRELLRNKFAQNFLDDSEKEESSLQRAMLRGIVEVINLHLSDPDFNLESFSSELGMSRSQLYRKVRSISGTTPNELVRIVRMKHAARLLRHNHLNVSQVMYEVGMKNPSHFAKAFRKYFGENPNEYRNHTS